MTADTYEPRTTTAWCPTCGSRQPVADETTGSAMTHRGEVEYPVVQMECGHQLEGPDEIVADAPGAPYAGPDIVTAADTSGREVRRARGRNREADPWAI